LKKKKRCRLTGEKVGIDLRRTGTVGGKFGYISGFGYIQSTVKIYVLNESLRYLS